MSINTEHFKDLLEKELSILETELPTVGRKNPDNPSDWEATEKPNEAINADEFDVADKMEEFENNRGILNQLEVRLNEVKNALQKIEDGKYGICETGGEEIEEDRLEANPAATTCKLHMN
ncbi:MAG TPA: TraR/DksA C4-type zinc finger protein [Candidatus Paceibacterota bacterium]